MGKVTGTVVVVHLSSKLGRTESVIPTLKTWGGAMETVPALRELQGRELVAVGEFLDLVKCHPIRRLST